MAEYPTDLYLDVRKAITIFTSVVFRVVVVFMNESSTMMVEIRECKTHKEVNCHV